MFIEESDEVFRLDAARDEVHRLVWIELEFVRDEKSCKDTD